MAVGQYILDDDGNPQREPDLIKWAMWMEYSPQRVVAQDSFGEVRVSTIFMGLDFLPYREIDKLPPILFETMVFGGKHHDYQRRYSTRAEAVAGHAAAILMVKADTN